ncbi:LysR family transcriptional regulator [Billgrantia kenyensis]|uniref:LysR family transcriptional regulator n=1 Tax=Billgrantia kenyensis TaxID=321266 RepID=A0A7W0AEL9_9GAMM|nr:LysR family transcriptional regulator [Halomonas kenyensis]MBA2779739.1 LysR family transcriptional regulator [Halomonas kenyensis]MCG6662576.1 LysR family transcriptional regulator [Halomonas kenyensis]
MYNLDELLAFDHVMRSGSLTRSARDLDLAKSTLSRRISQLERQLGQPLLRRQSNRLLPTEAGHTFHAYCHQILALAEQGRQALEELSEEITGELHVATHNALARSWLATRLARFMENHPGVRLTLQTCTAPPLSAESQALTVWLGEVPDSELRQEVLGWLSRSLYGHPDYLARRGKPRHPRELAQHTWIDLLGETEQGLALQHSELGEFHFQPPDSRFRVDQQMLHGDAIAGGHGLGIMPDWLAGARERAHPGSLERCLPAWCAASVPVTLLYPYGARPRRLSALLAFLRQSLPDAWQRALS